MTGRPPTRRGVDKENTRLFSMIVRGRARHRCEVCGGHATDAHHIVGRNCRRLKYEPRNGLACCGTCHSWAGTHHGAFSEWMRKHRPADYVWLAKPENTAPTHWTLDDYLEIRQRLRDELSSLLADAA